jgi:pimeloyl-ACP methyl ester carboxylesterase
MPEAVTIKSQQILAGDVRCHYLEAGQGEPLVLLHGTAIDSASLSYRPSLPYLSRQHRTIALDWPGYGQSELPRTSLTSNDYVQLLLRFLDALGLERVHLAGFSMGGAIALGLALHAPKRLATLTMISSYGLDANLPVPLIPYLALRAPKLRKTVIWGLRRSRLLTRLVLRHLVLADPTLLTPELVNDVHNQLRAPEAERSFLAWLRGELRPLRLVTSYADRLNEVNTPTLLLHGRRDRVISWRKAELAQKQLPKARLVVVPSCGHWLPREAPETFREELLEFTQTHAIQSQP